MDKYKLAIIEYESCRKDIAQLTIAIGEESRAPMGEDGVFSGTKCTNYQGSFPSSTACIERYWQDNKDWKESEEYEELNEFDYADRVPVTLCPSCSEVDRLVIERKERKQKFGVAKRRIGQLARGLINKGKD